MRTISVDTSLADQVFEAVRESITTGELAPGSLHSVYRLADELGVSRTPVREACVRLAHAGMVRFERNRGIRILQAGVHDVVEVLQLRLMLEVPAAGAAVLAGDAGLVKALRVELAAMRRAARARDAAVFMAHDRRFHQRLLEATGNRRLVEAVRDLRDATSTRGASTAGRSRTMRDIADEHQPILDAVISGDPAQASAAMRDHLTHTGGLLIAQVAAETGEDVPAVDEFRPSIWSTVMTLG